LLDVQLKAGWYLKRILRTHTLTAVAVSIANAKTGQTYCLLGEVIYGLPVTHCGTPCLIFFGIFLMEIRVALTAKIRLRNQTFLWLSGSPPNR
jgi:hypothetical protein